LTGPAPRTLPADSCSRENGGWWRTQCQQKSHLQYKLALWQRRIIFVVNTFQFIIKKKLCYNNVRKGYVSQYWFLII
jgi:hypothetical protein